MKFLKSIVWLVIIIFAFSIFVGELRYLPSESMEPTLRKNQKILVQNTFFPKKQYQRGDIITFYGVSAFDNRDPSEIDLDNLKGISTFDYYFKGFLFSQIVRLLPFIEGPEVSLKRIVAIAGDRVQVVAGQGVFINGKEIDAPYAKHYLRAEKTTKETLVAKNKYYVLGDNINYSFDSQYFGAIPRSRINGLATKRIFVEDGLRILPI